MKNLNADVVSREEFNGMCNHLQGELQKMSNQQKQTTRGLLAVTTVLTLSVIAFVIVLI